jgi:hypothetical protein
MRIDSNWQHYVEAVSFVEDIFYLNFWFKQQCNSQAFLYSCQFYVKCLAGRQIRTVQPFVNVEKSIAYRCVCVFQVVECLFVSEWSKFVICFWDGGPQVDGNVMLTCFLFCFYMLKCWSIFTQFDQAESKVNNS